MRIRNNCRVQLVKQYVLQKKVHNYQEKQIKITDKYTVRIKMQANHHLLKVVLVNYEIF